jgi:phosphopantothenoylcysteine decarboxylase/phosphopantothenate--cysteine ligase
MGYALAAVAARRGAAVTLVSGPVALAPPHGVERIAVETASEMREAVLRVRTGAEAVFMAAAVSDFVPRMREHKLKRRDGPPAIDFEPAPDILAELGRGRAERLLVGFAAETEALVANAREKLTAKNVDFIVANDVSRADIGLDADDNAVTILGRDGSCKELPKASKVEIAEAILDHVLAPVPTEHPA